MLTEEEVWAFLCDCAAGVFKPVPEMEIHEWAEQYMRFADIESTILAKQLYQSRFTPYHIEILKWLRYAPAGRLYIRKGSQMAITYCCIIFIAWSLVHNPINVIYGVTTESDLEKIVKRFADALKTNGITTSAGESDKELKRLKFTFSSMNVIFANFNARGSLRSDPADVVFIDEAAIVKDDAGDGHVFELAAGRVKRNVDFGKVVIFSSPEYDDHRFAQDCEAASRSKFFLTCPKCGHKQSLEWSNVKYDHIRDLSGELDLHQFQEKVYYECAGEKKCQLTDRERAQMWNDYELRPTNPRPIPNYTSIFLPELYSAFERRDSLIATLAVKWVLAQGDGVKMKDFICNNLGEPYKRKTGNVGENKFHLLKRDYVYGCCPTVEVMPRAPMFTFAVGDSQIRSVKYIVGCFDWEGNLYIIRQGEAPDREAFKAEIKKPIEASRDDVEDGIILVDWALLDEGGAGGTTEAVREFCAENYPFIQPVKGSRPLKGMSEIWQNNYQVRGMLTPYVTHQIVDSYFKRELIYEYVANADVRRERGKPVLVLPRSDRVQPFIDECKGTYFAKQKSGKWDWQEGEIHDFMDCAKYAIALWKIASPNYFAGVDGLTGTDQHELEFSEPESEPES